MAVIVAAAATGLVLSVPTFGSGLGRLASSASPRTASQWSCADTSYFQVVNGQVSTSVNLVTWQRVGRRGVPLNALGFSPYTGFLYGLRAEHGPDLYDLVRIDRNGAETDLGPIAGLDRSDPWVGGDIDAETGLYYVSSGPNRLDAVNLSTRVATPVSVPAAVTLGQDLVVQQSWVWSVSARYVDGFSLQTGATKQFPVTSAARGTASGAAWGDVDADAMVIRWNNSGIVVRFSGLRSDALTSTVVAHGQRTSQVLSDGATCTSVQPRVPDNAPTLVVGGNPLGPLWPGRSRLIDLTFTNSYSTPLVVAARAVAIELSVSNPRCSAAANFAVQWGLRATVTIPADTTTSLRQLRLPLSQWPSIVMRNTGRNQDACEGATVTLAYTYRYSGQ